MREILFRGKQVDDNEWIEGHYCSWKSTNLLQQKKIVKGLLSLNHYIVTDGGTGWGYLNKIIPETVGQYTGLTDKNETKIFEGDIIKQTFEIIIKERYDDEIEETYIWGYDIGKVIIIPSKGACIKNPYRHIEKDCEVAEEDKKIKMYKNISAYRCVVIGNVYDNPELLEEQ